jgi:triosephosphate isomerase (TIM)
MSQESSRSITIVGNWKMYKTIEEALTYVETLASLTQKSQAAIYLAVPFTAIYPTSQRVRELQASFKIGAQNMNDASEGAFTGEIAARMLVDAGAQFVILGHSERRHVFQETNTFVNQKVKRALSEKLTPLVCIGETLEEREQGLFAEVLKNQILQSLKGIRSLRSVMLAYEPIWAIGTGKWQLLKMLMKLITFVAQLLLRNGERKRRRS